MPGNSRGMRVVVIFRVISAQPLVLVINVHVAIGVKHFAHSPLLIGLQSYQITSRYHGLLRPRCSAPVCDCIGTRLPPAGCSEGSRISTRDRLGGALRRRSCVCLAHCRRRSHTTKQECDSAKCHPCGNKPPRRQSQLKHSTNLRPESVGLHLTHEWRMRNEPSTHGNASQLSGLQER